MTIAVISKGKLYLLPYTAYYMALVYQQAKEVGTEGQGTRPEFGTPELMEYNQQNWPATAELEDILGNTPAMAMPYDNKVDMVVNLILEW